MIEMPPEDCPEAIALRDAFERVIRHFDEVRNVLGEDAYIKELAMFRAQGAIHLARSQAAETLKMKAPGAVERRAPGGAGGCFLRQGPGGRRRCHLRVRPASERSRGSMR